MRATLAALPIFAAALVMPAAAQPPVAAPDAFVQPEKGNCIACHQVPEGTGPLTRANLGPALDGTRMRALGRARIRALIDDPTRDNPDTVMPPFGRHRILNTAEIQQLVEYLFALP